MTIEEYEHLPDTGVRTELVDGEVLELESGNLLHSWVRDETRAALRRAGIGAAFAEVEFHTIGSRVRLADVVWFAMGRLIQSDWSRSIMPVPDLAVEVVSPKDLADSVTDKVREYLDAGVTSVWIIYPDSRDADIWNRGRGLTAVRECLTADRLPGVSIPLQRIFECELLSA